MKDLFEIAGGTIIGKDHLLVGKNNQDAFHFSINDDAVIAVVCDGCGEGKNSEVGARVGAKLITKTIAQATDRLPGREDSAQFWERIRQDVLAQLRVLANAMDKSLSQVILDYFLFTVVGVIINPKNLVTFSLGDGLIIVNEEAVPLGPFPNNEPPYLTYGITGSSITDKNPELLQFKINSIINTDDVQSILIGTDGVLDLMRVAELNVPGKDEVVGSISQFWENDRYFKNPDMVRRKLSLINREVIRPDWKNEKIVKENGLLPDDTTLVVIRKKN